jgi:hypothetical protein
VVQYNVLSGIILFPIGTLISYIVTLRGYFYFPGDIQFVIGAFVGTIFSLSFKREEQSPIKIGIVVGLIGGALSVLVLAFFNWIYSIILFEFNVVVFLYAVSRMGIQGLVIGVLIGLLMGVWYWRRDLVKKTEKKSGEKLVDDDFFEKLKD